MSFKALTLAAVGAFGSSTTRARTVAGSGNLLKLLCSVPVGLRPYARESRRARFIDHAMEFDQAASPLVVISFLPRPTLHYTTDALNKFLAFFLRKLLA